MATTHSAILPAEPTASLAYSDVPTPASSDVAEKEFNSSKNSFSGEKIADVESLDDGRIHGHVLKDGVRVNVSWTKEEERRVVRKADLRLVPVLMILFFFMALDRTNISGVLTSTFLKDTNITRDELWLGIVLLEIPSNIVLQRIGPTLWISGQVVAFGFAELMHMFVRNKAGFYTGRFALGLLESGFIPGSLYTLSRWYTRGELAKRSVVFFYGTSLSSAFGSLIAAGCISIDGHLGLHGWQWIFMVCGTGTMTAGVLSFLLLPRDPRRTSNFLFKPWFTEREADVFLARIESDDPLKEQGTVLKIGFKDIVGVLTDWRVVPHLLMCLSGLQSVGGLSVWGATIIKSLGFSAIRANLLNTPGPLLTMLTTIIIAFPVDRYRRYGWAINFAALWTVVGLIAVYHLPISATNGSWSFYAALIFTLAAPNWQALNVTWIAMSMRTPQRRAVAYALYIGCSNLGGTYGPHVFRGSDAPKYRKAWAGCLALGAVWLAVSLFQWLQYYLTNRSKAKKWAQLTPEEQEHYSATTTETSGKRLDFIYPL
ncbi:hypothetical protein JCM6882_009729 [Rhodosporidiobolus microsporus]